MCDFSKFETIFGITKSNAKSPTNLTSKTPIRKRKQNLQKNETNKRKQKLEEAESGFVLELSMRKNLRNESIAKSPLTRVQNLGTKFSSPDKREIIQNLSCNVEDFVKEPEENHDTDTSDDL